MVRSSPCGGRPPSRQRAALVAAGVVSVLIFPRWHYSYWHPVPKHRLAGSQTADKDPQNRRAPRIIGDQPGINPTVDIAEKR